MPLALISLTLSSFAIGTTEFVLVGLVPIIADDLTVSVSSAGWLVGIYALGVATGAPVLTALTAGWPRKVVLLSLMALFVVGNLLAWQAPDYPVLILARIVTGLAHGLFFSIGSTIAASLVRADKAARAIALMFAGLTLALVTGVPLGTFIGQHFGWRATFLIVALLGLAALIGIVLMVPGQLRQAPLPKLALVFTPLTHPRLLLVYLMTILGYGAPFVCFTFLTPILQQVTGVKADTISLLLLLYGVSVVIGNLYGGRLADRWGPIRALYLLFGGLALILLLFYWCAGSKPLTLITILIWGAFAFGNVPVLQTYVVILAGRLTPDAVSVASGLNISAFNIGITLCSWLGGLVVKHSRLIDTTWIGALIAILAIVLVAISGTLERKSAKQP